MILFKKPELQRELTEINPNLRQIVNVVEFLAWEKYRDDLVVTEILRADQTSVHHYGRGIDIAILKHGGVQGSERLRHAINIMYPYGKEGVVTIPPLRHGTAPHIHIQVK